MHGEIKQKKSTRLIFWINIYLIGTLVLYEFGVWDFHTNNPGLFYLLVISYQIALTAGYFFGTKIKINTVPAYRFLTIKWIRIFLVINIFMAFLSAVRMGGLNSFNIGALWERIVYAFVNVAAGYNNKSEITQNTIFLGSFGTILLALWSPISYAMIPIGFYYYKKMTKMDKVVLWINLIVTAVGALITGTTKRVLDIAIAAIVYYVLMPNGKRIPLRERLTAGEYEIRRKRGKNLTKIVIAALIASFVANYFVGSRGIGTYWNASFYRLGGSVIIDQDSIFFKILPSFLHGFLAILCSYLTQGYYGFSFATSVSGYQYRLENCSLWLVDQFGRNSETIQYQIERISGWDSRMNWCTAYSWLANGVGLFGVILVMALIGMMLSGLYKEYSRQQSVVSYVLLYYMAITIFFLPCNLQIFQDINGVMGFLFFFLLWIGSHVARRQ